MTWTQFLRSQAAVACDFDTIDTAFLRRYYLLFFIHVTTHEVYFAAITAKPTGLWTTQADRNLFLCHGDRFTGALALVRNRDSQFVDSFDEAFRTEGLKILKSPGPNPNRNTLAEHWIGNLRRELLDRTIIENQRQLEQLVVEYIDHYNNHRPHRSLSQQPPRPAIPIETPSNASPPLRVARTTRTRRRTNVVPIRPNQPIQRHTTCAGLINQYRPAA